ncbi:DNA-3-methyladenine glycosylase family protein [Paracoccus yeei]|uniref:DNA-3-methyladenine glycosylase II n=1 Tax=Paracoccus yeei TaxID=147645 RepID=A0A5P2QSK3_9RHOB|nr:DNA-3-methyladenine glycosylase [Paracoccus yeei]MBY0136955.1 DNA-3-methyladenine glycosylase 2 family protein [Paracoccus yeei]QEU08895.1 DNA-3-methyladenine glycosylase 2 family protein [Paracoccus yeei]
MIRDAADLAMGAAHLARVCPVWARVLPELGPLPLRRWEEGFPSIRDAVVSQQISTQAAGAILARLAAAGLSDEAAIRAADDDALRAAGLSRPKARYLRGIAEARVDWAALRNLPDDQAIANLTALPGIGRWTAEIYLKFALGRPDVFAAGDLALAESARLLYGLPERPGPAALIALAEPWRPWRAVAARALWAYYHVAKGREGVR